MEAESSFLMRDWPTFWSAVSAIVPSLALLATLVAWLRRRRDDLRLSDVLSWSMASIRALQELRYLMHADALSQEDARRLEIETSTLTEIGRLFFKNEDRRDGHGSEKLPPYQGHRPSILDPLVLAHQIACEFGEATADIKKRYNVVLAEAEGKFVSLAQQEIGREKTAHKSTSKGGPGDKLDTLAAEVTEAKLSKPLRKHL